MNRACTQNLVWHVTASVTNKRTASFFRVLTRKECFVSSTDGVGGGGDATGG
jgi:hypothetical protein